MKRYAFDVDVTHIEYHHQTLYIEVKSDSFEHARVVAHQIAKDSKPCADESLAPSEWCRCVRANRESETEQTIVDTIFRSGLPTPPNPYTTETWSVECPICSDVVDFENEPQEGQQVECGCCHYTFKLGTPIP